VIAERHGGVTSKVVGYHHTVPCPVKSCPHCGGVDTVEIGGFYPDDSGEIMKCLDCDFEWGD